MLSAETWLALSHPLVVAMVGGAILTLWCTDPIRPRYLLYFGSAYFAYSLAVTLQISSFPSSVPLNVLLSGTLYMVAVVLLTNGLIILSEREYSYWFPLLVISIMLTARLYFVLFDDNPKLRIYLLHIAIVTVLLHGAYLARHLRKGRPTEKVLYYSFLILALSNAPRMIFAVMRPDERYGFDLNAYWLITQLSIYVFSIIFGLALILTLMQKRVFAHRELSETDALTGLRNRRGFFDSVQRLIRRLDSYTILIADIDHFKKVNDTYGHTVGDVVLAETAQIVQQSIRPGDVAGRIGGEEFAIFLPNTSIEDGHNVAERLRQNFEKFTFSAGKSNIRCTISLGAAAFHHSTPINDAMLEADELLYYAKASGRNRVVSAPEPVNLSPAMPISKSA